MAAGDGRALHARPSGEPGTGPRLDRSARLPAGRARSARRGYAATGDATESVVRAFPRWRYVCEPQPGLDRARNRAIAESRGEIVAFTDDDVEVDPGWVRAAAIHFANPEVMAVTGLVEPAELETRAQERFEIYRRVRSRLRGALLHDGRAAHLDLG